MSTKYRDLILNRNGKVVFRPDSGDPVEVNAKIIDILWRNFGGTYVHGYKLLPPQVGIIQGDGIDIDMIESILTMAKAKGFSSDNWVFGSGGGLLQKFDRDTQKFAIKASYGEKEENFYASPESVEPGIKTVGFPIQKDPVTSSGKKSKAGKLKLLRSNDSFLTISSVNESYAMFNSYDDQLETVFENGKLVRYQSFNKIRQNAEYWFNKSL